MKKSFDLTFALTAVSSNMKSKMFVSLNTLIAKYFYILSCLIDANIKINLGTVKNWNVFNYNAKVVH